MSLREACPRCGREHPEWLSTTNQWRWYCPDCDIRFNDEGEVLGADSERDYWTKEYDKEFKGKP